MSLTKKRGRPRDEPALVAALFRGTLAVASDPRAPLTIDSVVAAAGTSKPRVYRYFPSAEAAFSRVLAEIAEAQARAIIDASSLPASPEERYRRVRGLFASPTPEQKTAWRLELRAVEVAAGDATLADQLAGADLRVVAALIDLFRAAEGERPLANGFTPDTAGRTFRHLLRGCTASLLASSGEDPLAAVDVFWHAATNGTSKSSNGHR